MISKPGMEKYAAICNVIYRATGVFRSLHDTYHGKTYGIVELMVRATRIQKMLGRNS